MALKEQPVPLRPHANPCRFQSKSPIQQYSATIHSMIHNPTLSSATADAPLLPGGNSPSGLPAATPPLPLPLNPPTRYHLHVSVGSETPSTLNSNLLHTLCPDPWLRPASLPCHANLIQKHFLWQPVNVRVDFLFLLCSPAKHTARPHCQEPSLV